MTLRLLLFDLYAALNNVYSGWILWNLFLAFIPLLLSFILFRRQALGWRWFVASCFLISAIGIIGTRLRTPRVFRHFLRHVDRAIASDFVTQLHLLWFLALILFTLGMSIWLFKREATLRTVLWWVGFVTFMAFLPNAPYVLTDIIHLIHGIGSRETPTLIIVVVFIPMHVFAILLAFEAYVIAILNLIYALKKKASNRWILPTELLIHFLSAIGIYLGRFLRLNSWDFVVDPTSVMANTLNTLTSKRPLAVIAIAFIMLTVLYWLMKQVTLGLKLRLRYARQGIDVLD